MKVIRFALPMVFGLLLSTAHAQAPAGAPAGATGVCKDGSYWTGASKSGACSGHKGVQTWFGPASSGAAKPAAGTAKSKNAAAPATAATPATPAAPATPAKPAPAAAAAMKPAPAPKATPAAAAVPAPGGGAGQVWVNTETKVYHCSGDRYYGKTKKGQYMSEADAQKMGARPDANKPCKK